MSDLPALQASDAEIYALIRSETRRQDESIRLIASENYASSAVLEATGSLLANKYSEGYPGRRYYEGQDYIDQIETLAIERANQVWAMDITYVPMARGFVFLTAVLDWHSRRVLAHRVSITMEADFCVEALQEAIAKYGTPEIMNTDQGAQFTGAEFIGELRANGIAVSMDGRGQWRDNVFVERLWKSVKYEDVYLKAYESVSAARAGISRYIDFYNSRRPHRAHGGRTPDVVYFAALPAIEQAA